MPRNSTSEGRVPITLEEALAARLERRFRLVDRLRLPERAAPEEDGPTSSLQALAEKVTRLRRQAEILAGRSAS